VEYGFSLSLLIIINYIRLILIWSFILFTFLFHL